MTKFGRLIAGSASAATSRVMEVATPLLVVALAFLLWEISDRLLYVGLLDRATFGWYVLLPIWTLAPLTAGFAWLHLSPRTRTLAATVCGFTIGVIAAILYVQVAPVPDCQYGTLFYGPTHLDLVATGIGTLIGGGFGLSGLAASTQVRAGHPWRAVLAGAAVQVAAMFVAILLVAGPFAAGVCQRPPA
jgi:hypothetical protein